MKAFVQDAIGSYGERDLEPPRPGPGEVILKMRAALTCGTDLKLLSRGHARIALPATMGHEVCGEVAALGEGVTGWRLGERAVPGVSGPCGRCRECRAGRENLCPSAHADRTWGAFAERVRVPAAVVASSLHRVPAGLDDEVAAFVDPLASVLHGWSRLREPRGTLLVYGAGALALLWAAVASRRGLEVVVAGRRAERAALAERFGARFVRVGAGGDEPADSADVAVDATGDARVWERLPALVRPGGQVLLFGGCAPGAAVTFDAARLHYGEIALLGSFHYTPRDARAALGALASGEVDPRPLIADRGPLSALPGFLEAQARGDGVRYAVRGDA
ncbi:MAG TPA: alcohol dehydrogenase catalytic domain-containing protein [Thermoanaerobaculia bacterium]|nr:alcohol dehydrogenase catalytic domain-containing protein [Thermoanaerobaculia bacterium]